MPAIATGIQQDWLNHKALQIIKGLPQVPGDQFSAEAKLTIFDLMSGTVSLDPEDEWSPQIAPVKNGGVWTESPISDGRRLLAAPAGNVIEKITILISGSGYLEVMKQFVNGLAKQVHGTIIAVEYK